MVQGNICYRLLANTDYTPGAFYTAGLTGATGGPASGEQPINGVYVGPGAAVLDFFDTKLTRNIITVASGNTGIYLPITVMKTGSSLSGSIFGFSAGNIYGTAQKF